MRTIKGEWAHVIFNRCPIETHDGASAKFSTNSLETDTSAVQFVQKYKIRYPIECYELPTFGSKKCSYSIWLSLCCLFFHQYYKQDVSLPSQTVYYSSICPNLNVCVRKAYVSLLFTSPSSLIHIPYCRGIKSTLA
jgi:hypothetical protein